VDLDVGARSRRGKDTCKPTGKWVMSGYEWATGRERKEV